MADLEEALENNRKAIEDGLEAARTELEDLRARESELLALIERAEAALGRSTPDARTSERQPTLTLHEALIRILEENGGGPMTVQELTRETNERSLYTKRNGSPVEVNQVHARTNNYPALFEKDGANIRLRKESRMLATTPKDIDLFRDDDRGFFDWLDEHPQGFFLNTERNPKPTYLVLHRPGCHHFTGNPSKHWTKDYVKLCADSRRDIEEWAASAVGGEPTLCPSCFD